VTVEKCAELLCTCGEVLKVLWQFFFAAEPKIFTSLLLNLLGASGVVI
jgi:hypothetical protein